MVVVGLTGGIGSGKTTALQMFKKLGVSCYVSDIEAKRLMNENLELRVKLIEVFGEEVYNDEGLNRLYLADIVFKSKEKLALLNSIVHPFVHTDLENFINNAKGCYVIYESAILFENNREASCNFIITITSPLETRIKRVLSRDKTTREAILNRISNQLSDDIKVSKSDFVLTNTTLASLEKQVFSIHKEMVNSHC